VEQLTRPLARISGSARVDEVLRQMREERVHLASRSSNSRKKALVHDDHGTVIGLLTMEDILEELVGEIEGEFDLARAELFHEEDGRLWVDGQTPIRALAERLRFELEVHHEKTVSRYLLEQLARVPDVGEVIECHGHRFEIVALLPRRRSRRWRSRRPRSRACLTDKEPIFSVA
jgi:CBS domain containing-hemolysin-like protein